MILRAFLVTSSAWAGQSKQPEKGYIYPLIKDYGKVVDPEGASILPRPGDKDTLQEVEVAAATVIIQKQMAEYGYFPFH